MNRKKILVVDDEKLIRWSVNQKLAEWNYDVIEAENGEKGIQLFSGQDPDLAILDVNLPDTKGTELLSEMKAQRADIPVIMITAYGSIDDAVSAMRQGAYDFITKPIDFLKLQNALKNALETASLKNEVAFYKEKEQKGFDLRYIVAVSAAMREVLKITETVAASEVATVLLQGESGTGKDLLAQAIHHLSRRRTAAYMAINCSAIPENLLESELFGYEKGAFTDAKQQKKGLAEIASGGTLFLDEISTLELPLQAKLLRFLETQTFKRIGGLRDIDVDLRVIAATNQDLEQASQDGAFRRDLFYRLNVCPIFIPPLRERIDDILPLTAHFIRQYNLKFRKNIRGLTRKAERLILDHGWPGNIRELKNAVERAMIFEQGPRLTPEHLPIRLDRKPSPDTSGLISEGSLGEQSLDQMEKAMLLNALRKAGGNKSHAARILGITRDTLRYKIKKWRIDTDSPSSTE